MSGGSRNRTPLVGNTGGACPSVRVINHPAPGRGDTCRENSCEREIIPIEISDYNPLHVMRAEIPIPCAVKGRFHAAKATAKSQSVF
jgi:hypothetical protein